MIKYLGGNTHNNNRPITIQGVAINKTERYELPKNNVYIMLK